MASAQIQEIRGEVQAYQPGKSSIFPSVIKFPENLHIGLFGKTGSGKTSFINSLKFAVMGNLRRTKWVPVGSQEKSGGHTIFRKLVYITSQIGVVDNRGLDDLTSALKFSELTAQLDGKRGYSEVVEWTGNSSYSAVPKNPINCVVFIFSADHDTTNAVHGLKAVVDYLHKYQGRYPVAVITHVDNWDESRIQPLKAILRGTGVSEIFEVANLTENNPALDEKTQLTLLNFLDRCMTDGDEGIVFRYYKRTEQEEHEEAMRRQQMLTESQKRGWCTLL